MTTPRKRLAALAIRRLVAERDAALRRAEAAEALLREISENWEDWPQEAWDDAAKRARDLLAKDQGGEEGE